VQHILTCTGDPLMHLVRNSLAHGIEAPKVRIARGKPARHPLDRVVECVELPAGSRRRDFMDLRGEVPIQCPVTALTTWMTLAGISSGPVFRLVSKGNRAIARQAHAEAEDGAWTTSTGVTETVDRPSARLVEPLPIDTTPCGQAFQHVAVHTQSESYVRGRDVSPAAPGARGSRY
jgi:hypothetical protein